MVTRRCLSVKAAYQYEAEAVFEVEGAIGTKQCEYNGRARHAVIMTPL